MFDRQVTLAQSNRAVWTASAYGGARRTRGRKPKNGDRLDLSPKQSRLLQARQRPDRADQLRACTRRTTALASVDQLGTRGVGSTGSRAPWLRPGGAEVSLGSTPEALRVHGRGLIAPPVPHQPSMSSDASLRQRKHPNQAAPLRQRDIRQPGLRGGLAGAAAGADGAILAAVDLEGDRRARNVAVEASLPEPAVPPKTMPLAVASAEAVIAAPFSERYSQAR